MSDVSNTIETAFNLFAGWLHAHVEDFSFDQDRNPSTQILFMKPFAELLLCLDVMESYTPIPTAQSIFQWAWKKLEQGDHLFRLLLARPDFCQLSSIYASLQRKGFTSDRLERLLKQIAQMRSVKSLEMAAWVRQSIDYTWHRIGLLPYTDESFSKGWTASLPEPWTIHDEAAYAVTHELFFLTDFGRHPYEFSLMQRDYLGLWLPCWAEYYAELPNWDLSGELAISGMCIGIDHWCQDFLTRLTIVQCANGQIIGPVGAGYQLIRENDSESRRTFLQNYHPTLVAGVAFSMYLAKHGRSIAIGTKTPPQER